MKLINLTIIKDITLKKEKSRDFYLYYVLRGHAHIEDNNKVFPLENTEIIVINPDEIYTMHCEGVVVECRISHSEVLRLMGHQRKMIVCYTHQINNENTEELKRTLNGLLRSYYESGQNRIVQEQYSLSLVYSLITNFSNNIFDDSDSSRKNEIALYIEANYADDLTLDTIADAFALTPQYFSRYFKNEFQMSFLKYLNQVRLRYATEDLLSTNETILRIAIDNGFANIASFNREFHETYHMTPGAYRQLHKTKQQEIHQEDILSYLEEDKKEEKGNTIQYKFTSLQRIVILLLKNIGQKSSMPEVLKQ
ncbi:MAG: helix-turn-helix transcriptional regulator [Faecalicoccus sp.]|nr:helix-turn-helix transcriptional regulator [Faecalicoccus sp.]